MSKFIFINNKLLPEHEANISVFDRSYLYGEGVFETLRAYNGHIAFADLHYERLKKNCKRLNIDLPLGRHELEKALLKTINANGYKDAYIRVTVSPVGASFGINRPKRMTTNVSIFCNSTSTKKSDLYSKGARVLILSDIPSDSPGMATLKSTNYLSKIMARDQVIKAEADEGILLTPEGNILEGSASNIFIVKNKKIFTPPLSEGVLPGVTRNVVLNIAEANNFAIKESPISLSKLKNCDEAFLTGSTSEILPVKELINLAIKSPTPGPITKKVMSAYEELLP